MNGMHLFSPIRSVNTPDQLPDQRVNQTASQNSNNAAMAFGKGEKTKSKVLTRRSKIKSVQLAFDMMHDGSHWLNQANRERDNSNE